jgi:hypothetical protein
MTRDLAHKTQRTLQSQRDVVPKSMIFSPLLLLIVVLLVSPSKSFTPTAHSRWHSTSTTALHQEKTNWVEYKHDYVDPLIPRAIESKIHDHVNPTKRKVSDEYWLRQMEQDKEKLQKYMIQEEEEEMSDNDNVLVRQEHPQETFQHYKQTHIDPMTRHSSPSPVTSHLDPVKRQNADKFWRAKLMDDKEKARRKYKENREEKNFCQQRDLYK